MVKVSRRSDGGKSTKMSFKNVRYGAQKTVSKHLKTCRVGLPEECYFKCVEEVMCQSYNFVIGQNICKLNNRTKEARQEDFLPDQRRFYIKRLTNRGTIQIYCLLLVSLNKPIGSLSKIQLFITGVSHHVAVLFVGS